MAHNMGRHTDRDYFAHARVGLFTHYTYPTYSGKGKDWGGTWHSQTDSSHGRDAEEVAALFDGEAYAAAAADLGAQYVTFTVCHAGFNLLFPSQTMLGTGCDHKCSRTDLVAKLLAGLEKYDIPLVLYMPPNDNHDIPDADLAKMGWSDDDGREKFLIRLIREIYSRYGSRIAGFWFDQGGPRQGVCDAVRQCDPDAVIYINDGVTANEKRHVNSDFIVSEYYGSIENCDSDTLPVHYSQVNRQIGSWWACGGHAPTDARNLYRYTVRTISVTGQFNSGIAWSCGPHLDQTWETGVRELLHGLGELLRAHGESVYDTVPGVSYVTAPNSILAPEQWGVSTESRDGSEVYLHVLNVPADHILRLPPPADGKVFSAASCGGQCLNFENGTIELPRSCDPVDTVVTLEVKR